MTEKMLTTADLAEMLQVAQSTIRHWRQTGQGPRYVKFAGGQKVRYHPRDVDRWVVSQTRATQRQL